MIFNFSTSWQNLKEAINKREIGEVIHRSELMVESYSTAENYIDGIRNQLTQCGYLKIVGRGAYQVLKHIEDEITTTGLRKMYEIL